MAAKQISQITQIGIVTGDLKKMMKNYEEKLGIGPFEIVVDGANGIGAKAENLKVHGKLQDFEVLVACCKLEAVEIELIQPLDDKSIYAEHLRKHGEGVINHIAIVTPDNAAFRTLMKEENVESILKGDVNPAEGESFEYFDCGELMGTIVELHDPEPVE
ncbi:methylmalonyl-CoA epimerase [uncultured Roseburia sp.]|uniref:VOC family protein n=1 Tax=Brotonthovivens ammoniilytica TaxID=2981725 RepID=A0ABT2THC2_9FIRM|nr:VOC family protein [Brotonthovivens ammoniilytica]MCU6761087.1 VOC family protein [Brotonthovivens ammoniilytica]SCI18440.1 methylmalonyl-CoA epimerase [uncultured Roseburia sp.]